MTFYAQHIINLHAELYPKDHLTEQVIRSRNFIEKNFSTNIRLDQFASAAFYSKFHFLRLFKLYYGTTPHQYLINVRIQKAKQLLRKGKSPLEVSTAVGFDSHTHFAMLFKKITGFTPAAFRKQKKGTKQAFYLTGLCLPANK